jgi:hypothetical protein
VSTIFTYCHIWLALHVSVHLHCSCGQADHLILLCVSFADDILSVRVHWLFQAIPWLARSVTSSYYLTLTRIYTRSWPLAIVQGLYRQKLR